MTSVSSDPAVTLPDLAAPLVLAINGGGVAASECRQNKDAGGGAGARSRLCRRVDIIGCRVTNGCAAVGTSLVNGAEILDILEDEGEREVLPDVIDAAVEYCGAVVRETLLQPA